MAKEANGMDSRLSIGLLAALVVVGCASYGVDRPEVSLADIRLEDVTLFETSGRITVRITNPSPEPAVIDGGSFHLHVDGRRVGRGVSDARLEIPRLSSDTLEMQFFVSNLALARRVMELLDRQAFDYRLEGRLYLWRSLGRRGVRFDHSGRFDLDASHGPERLDPALLDDDGDGTRR